MKMIRQTVQMPAVARAASVRMASLDEEARTVEVVVSTGARRKIRGWASDVEEELVMSAEAIVLERLNSVAPVLDNHRSYGSALDTLGAVVQGSARIEGGQLLATLRFARTDSGDKALSMIRDGILGSVSVGYDADYERIRARDREDGGELDLLRATRWEPYEVSLVAMPADIGAKIRGDEPRKTRAYEVRSFEEGKMEEEETQAQTPAPKQERHTDNPGPTVAQVTAQLTETRSLLGRFGLDAEKAAALVTEHDGDSVKIRSAILDLVSERDANKRIGGQHISMGEDEGTKHRSAIVDAVLHRMAPDRVKLDEKSGAYRQMRLQDIAREGLEARGISCKHRSGEEIVRTAMRSAGVGFHSTSDFAGILSDVANKRLRGEYTSRQSQWKRFSRRSDFADFRPINVYKISDFPDLKPVVEGGQYTDGTLNESLEQYRGDKAGRVISLTWEAMLADDLRAFEAGLRGAGRAARRREDGIVWGFITGNVVMGDGTALFDGSRGNIASAGGAPSLTTLSAGWTAMSTQNSDNPDGSLEPLNLIPAFWLCPQLQRMAARQVIGADGARAPDATTNQVPDEYRGLEVIADGFLDNSNTTISYLVASPSDIDTIEYGYLNGVEGPELLQEDGFRVDGTSYRVRHTFAAKVIDPKAFVRIPAT